jgi:hypothetical protein
MVPGEDVTEKVTRGQYLVDPTGGAGSKCQLTLRMKRVDQNGDALADVDFTIDAGSSKSDWSSGAATASTFKELVDLINEDDAGGTNGDLLACFRAYVLDVPYHAPFNSDDFIEVSTAVDILPGTGSGEYTEILQRDVSEYTDGNSDSVMYLRVGFPEPRDRAAFKLLDIEGTSTGNTNGVVEFYQDDIEDYTGNAPANLITKTLQTAQTSYVGDNRDDASTYVGPCILAVRSDDLSALSMRVKVQMDEQYPAM